MKSHADPPISGSNAPSNEPGSPDRRRLLSAGASLSMLAGLSASYGTLAVLAGRYLFTTQADTAWMFVAEAESIAPGETVDFESPTGVRVTVMRRANSAGGSDLSADDFSALSSVCPHLGCRVHWEAANQRYFCPCHNGVFDPSGRATEGPPAAANQVLPRYPLRVEQGLIFIEMPLNPIGLAHNVFLT